MNTPEDFLKGRNIKDRTIRVLTFNDKNYMLTDLMLDYAKVYAETLVKKCDLADVVKSLPTDDAEFIYSLLPKWAKDAPKGLNPTMYGTLTQEGDQKVIDRVKGILGNV